MSNDPSILREIPSIDALLSEPQVAEWQRRYPAFPLTRFLRGVLAEFRALANPVDAADGNDRAAVTRWIVTRAGARLGELQQGGQVRAINATGVVLHTNLGRAPLGEAAVTAAADAMAGYVTLELDAETGRRSHRALTVRALLELATGAEAAMVVNNNAAAVYLVAGSVPAPGRVIVSRGELVEIGGSFRLPEILRHAAREVVEVGTTNRTYAEDFARVARAGDLLLKVHKSNYAIEGFAHEPRIEALVEVGHRVGASTAYDLGSGSIYDFRAAGIGEDGPVADVLATGVDCVTMSGDKLLGGPQAGIIAGKRAFIDCLRQNPLRRAVRIDKVTIAALQEVLRGYLFGADVAAVSPAVARIVAGASGAQERAESVCAALIQELGRAAAVSAAPDTAAVGGGSLASQRIESFAVVLACADAGAANELARALRTGAPPVFPRVRDNEVRLNMATVLDGESDTLIRAVTAAVRKLN